MCVSRVVLVCRSVCCPITLCVACNVCDPVAMGVGCECICCDRAGVGVLGGVLDVCDFKQ